MSRGRTGARSYLSEELLNELFSPAVMKFPRFRRMTDVGAVHDQRQRLRLVNTAVYTRRGAHNSLDRHSTCLGLLYLTTTMFRKHVGGLA